MARVIYVHRSIEMMSWLDQLQQKPWLIIVEGFWFGKDLEGYWMLLVYWSGWNRNSIYPTARFQYPAFLYKISELIHNFWLLDIESTLYNLPQFLFKISEIHECQDLKRWTMRLDVCSKDMTWCMTSWRERLGVKAVATTIQLQRGAWDAMDDLCLSNIGIFFSRWATPTNLSDEFWRWKTPHFQGTFQ